MSTKTFTSRNDGMKNNIVVKSSGGGVHLTVTNHDLKQFGCDISSPDAPALALAVLESAQGDHAAMDADIAEVMQKLRKYVYAREKAAKEAADREALESEAVELICAVNSWDVTPFSTFGAGIQGDAIRLALKAREIHKAKS